MDKGLTSEQVETRKRQGLVNKSKNVFYKSFGRILASNFFSFFNIVLYIAIALMIYFKFYAGLYVGLVVLCNIALGLYQDISARAYLKKNKHLSKIVAIRNSQKVEISAKDIVIDDILLVEKGSTIYADAKIVHGNVCVNESLINGKDDILAKGKDEQLIAGSVVSSGTAHIQVTGVSSDCLANFTKDKAKRIIYAKPILLVSLQIIALVAGITSILIAGLITLTFLLQGTLSFGEELRLVIGPIINAIVTIMPVTLFLVTLIALTVESSKLVKKNVRIQNPYIIETLSKIDVLCLDKTKTITDGNLIVKKIIPLTARYLDVYIAQNVANVLRATNDQDDISLALLKHFDLQLSAGVNVALPFNSENKYSGASFKGGKTFIIGAPEYVPIRNKAGVVKRCEEFTKEGLRVVLLAEGKDIIKDNKYVGLLEPIALIVLKDQIRDGINETIAWFKQNNVDIKVISGDDPMAVSAISAEIGVPNAGKYISLRGRMLNEMEILVNEYTVFGDVSQEQKEALVIALKQSKKKVAMMGDGINDIIAMKRANCAISLDSASNEAKNVSDIILSSANINEIVEATKEGIRLNANFEKVAGLFVIKSIFALFFSLVSILNAFINKETYYPITINHFYLCDLAICGVSALLLLIFDNQQGTKGKFIPNVLKEALSASIMVILSSAIVITFYYLQQNNILNLGFYDRETVVSISVLVSIVFGNIFIYKACVPLSKKSVIPFICSVSICLVAIVIAIIFNCLNIDFGKEMFNISFSTISGVAYMSAVIIVVVLTSIYLFIYKLIDINKGEKEDNED